MFTWNPQWITPYESPWSVINKFMLANSITGYDAAKVLTTMQKRVVETYRNQYIDTNIVSNYQLNSLRLCTDNQTLLEYGKNTTDYLLKAFKDYTDKRIGFNKISNILTHKYLRFCPECMKKGEHKIYHQFTFLDKCLNHNVKLIEKCPFCNEPIQYLIDFKASLHSYQCTHCNQYLFKEPLENALEFWLSDLTDEERFTPANNLQYIPLLLSYNYNNTLTDQSIKDVMFSLYKNETINTKPRFQITDGLCINDMVINDNLRLSLAKENNYVDYAYAYTLQNEYTNLINDLGLEGKINQINEYINMCNVYKQINQQVLDRLITKYYDPKMLIIFLWKRNLEYCSYSNRYYVLDTMQPYQYKYQPDPVILKYLQQAEELLTPLVSEEILLSILCNIAAILMKEKYNNWIVYIENLTSRYDKFELLNVIRNVTIIDTNSTTTFLILLNKLKQEYLIYTE